jgi:hypothetical protein
MQGDSLKISIDTVSVAPVIIEPTDSISSDSNQIQIPVLKPVPKAVVDIAPVNIEHIVSEIPDSLEMGTTPVIVPELCMPINLYSTLNNTDSAYVKLKTRDIKNLNSEHIVLSVTPKTRSKVRVFEKEWVFGVTLFALVLFIIIRVYYQKYLATVIAALFNYHVGEKLLREKNVLVRRVFILLNTSYVIAMALYIHEVIKRFNVEVPINNDFYLFLSILSVFTGLIVFRLLILRLVAFVFVAVPEFREYMHSSFIVNKNLGLYLLPIVISTIYIKPALAQYMFYLATIMLVFSILIRYLKGIQIIIKHNIFLFYSILYLCTLEILPILIGVKFVLTQR